MTQLDIETGRAIRNYSTTEYASRILWGLVQSSVFRLSPRPLWRWRSFLLRLFGARLGRDVRINPSARIFAPWKLAIGSCSSIGDSVIVYSLGPITIGERVTVSQNVHLCAGSHDYTRATMPLLRLPILIEDDVWVAADAFVGPGVRIGQRAVVGARAVVTSDVLADVVTVGNPARPIKSRVIHQVDPS